MQGDVWRLREAGGPGVVLGVTFHRAFDEVADLARAREDLSSCGVRRVLTSGQRPPALLGRHLLRANDRIVILGGGQIRPGSVQSPLAEGPRPRFASRRTAASPTRPRAKAGSA